MRPSLLRRNPSLVIIRWHSREARKARDCLPSALPAPPVGGCLSLPSGSGGVSPPVSRRVNPPFLATLGLGGEQRGRRRRPPGPSSLPGCGWEPRCAEETWTGPLLSFGGAVLRGHVAVGVRPPPLHAMELASAPSEKQWPQAPGNGPAALQGSPTVAFTRSTSTECLPYAQPAGHRGHPSDRPLTA